MGRRPPSASTPTRSRGLLAAGLGLGLAALATGLMWPGLSPEPYNTNVLQQIRGWGDAPPAPEAVNAQAADWLRKSPIKAEPFLLAAAVEPFNTPRQARLLDESLTRSARSRLTRRLQLEAMTAEGRAAAAVEAIETLYRLDPRNRSDYIDKLQLIFLREDGRAVIDAALQDDPQWAQAFVLEVGRSYGFAANPDFDAAILRATRAYLAGQTGQSGRLSRGGRTVVTRLAYRMLEIGAADAAHAFWTEQVGADAARTLRPPSVVRDADFARPSTPPPFSWTVLDEDGLSGSFEPGGGLMMRYFGSKPTIALRQFIRLEPETAYGFEAAAEPQRRDMADAFRWEVVCVVPDVRTLFDAPLSDIDKGRGTEAVFETGSCNTAQLLLRTQTSGRSLRSSVLLQSIDIQPVSRTAPKIAPRERL